MEACSAWVDRQVEGNRRAPPARSPLVARKEVAMTDDRGEILRSGGTIRFVTPLVALDLTGEQFGPRFGAWLGQ